MPNGSSIREDINNIIDSLTTSENDMFEIPWTALFPGTLRSAVSSIKRKGHGYSLDCCAFIEFIDGAMNGALSLGMRIEDILANAMRLDEGAKERFEETGRAFNIAHRFTTAGTDADPDGAKGAGAELAWEVERLEFDDLPGLKKSDRGATNTHAAGYADQGNDNVEILLKETGGLGLGFTAAKTAADPDDAKGAGAELAWEVKELRSDDLLSGGGVDNPSQEVMDGVDQDWAEIMAAVQGNYPPEKTSEHTNNRTPNPPSSHVAAESRKNVGYTGNEPGVDRK